MSKISVCIPAYNYAHFLPDAIESVLCQSFQNFELLVVDNCSIDNTEEVVAEYVRKDRRVRYYRNESNLGLVGNLNRCLHYANGDFVKILCADDLLESGSLEKMAYVLEIYPQVSLVASSRLLTDSSLNPIRTASYSAKKTHISGIEVIKKCLVYGNLIGEPSAVLFRRKDALRGFREEYSQLVDLEMWFYLLLNGDFFFMPEELCLFRQHEGQGTKDNVRAFAYLAEEDQLFIEYSKKLALKSGAINCLNRNFRMAQAIWQQRNTCDNPEKIPELMGKYINYYLFFLIYLPVILMKKLGKIKDALLPERVSKR